MCLCRSGIITMQEWGEEEKFFFMGGAMKGFKKRYCVSKTT